MNILELFDKYLELVQEHETWIEYNCPICKHSGLKIKKENEYYKNFKCNCDIKRISSHILSKSGQKIERKPKELPIVIPSILNILGVKLSPIQNPPNIYLLDEDYRNLDIKLHYFYSDTQRTLRINRVKSTGKKIIFPQVLIGSSWVNGIGSNLFPIYTNQFTYKYLLDELFTNRPYLKGEVIVVVEGEKCVQYLQSRNVECISILNGYSNSLEKIKLVLEDSKSLIPNVKQFLYIPDLDAVGIKKASTFQQASWSIGLPCKIFDIRDRLLSPIGKGIGFDKGYDIADYIEENPSTNLMEIFENEFSK